METNKYFIPVKKYISDGDIYYAIIINQNNYAYLSYSSDFYPNYTITQLYLEHSDQFIQIGDSIYFITSDLPYIAQSNLQLDYFQITESQLAPYKDLSIYYSNSIAQINELQQLLDYSNQQITDLNNQIKEKDNYINSLLETTTPTDGLFIDIFRISPDGKYLEIDITCDNRYKFEHFYVKEYQNDSNIDILSLLGDEFNQDDSRILARISLDKLFGNSMYYANIEIELKEGESAEEVSDSNKQYEVAASDISNVYFYLLPGLVQLGHPCDPCDLEIPIEIQRAFLIMWAHIEAMKLERWGEAEMFYALIKNNFQNCLTEFEVKQKSCNCHAYKQSDFNFRR